MKNEYRIEGNTAKIFFRKTQGYFLIDKEDFERISRFTWYLNQNGYAESGKHIKAHHVVIGKPPEGMVTDHKNRNRLDNRKDNLHHVTYRENSKNRDMWGKELLGIRKYEGKRKTSYNVFLHDENGKTFNVGTFMSLDEAIKERDKAYEMVETRKVP